MTDPGDWIAPIIEGTIATVLAAGILSSFSKAARRRLWKPAFRRVGWLFTLRLTTTKRIEQEQAELLRLRGQAAQFNVTLKETYAKAQESVAEQRDELEREAEARHGKFLANVVAEREAARAKGRAEALAEVEQERAVPLLRPVWRIDRHGEADVYVLKNTQDGVRISNVSVDASTREFHFAGATQMRGDFDRHFEFYGEKTDFGRRLGVDFTVKWQDANGDWRTQAVHVDRDPRRTFVPS